MKERPILFSAPMVRAILAGTKIQTRRIVKPQPREVWGYGVPLPHVDKERRFGIDAKLSPERNAQWVPCPYGAPGDRLWLRETWQAIRCHDDGEVEEVHPIPKARGRFGIAYAATDEQADWHRDDRGFVWRPGIHMPRWASRITLEITGVRVERLHDITEEDARAEGVERYDDDGVTYYGPLNRGHALATVAFERLWREINGAESWDANPWVWVVEFKRVEAS